MHLDRASRSLRRRAPKPPTGAAMLYRSALRKALERAQAKLWAIIEAGYEEPKRDGLGFDFSFTIDQADERPLERYRSQLFASYVADCGPGGFAGAARPGFGEPLSSVTVYHDEGPRTYDLDAAEIWLGGLVLRGPFEVRTDAAADGGASRLRTVHVEMPATVLETVGARVAKKTTDETARLLGVEFKGGKKRRTPGGISRASQGADSKVISAFRDRNLGLIKRLEKQQVTELRGILEEATAKGWTVKTLRSRVMDRFQVAKSHADLIARDQTTKLNSAMTTMRHKAAGITKFRWSTSNDERVRESHAELDGKEFSYDDPPVVDGEEALPGEPVCCRCVAVAVVPWLEEES